MPYTIHFGIPEMQALWNELTDGEKDNKLGGNQLRLLKRLRKTLNFLSADPRHPSLESHEINPLTKRYGRKVWQSYLENRTPAAGRLYWIYGPERGQITVIGLEPHPEDRKSSYEQVALSSLPLITKSPARKPNQR